MTDQIVLNILSFLGEWLSKGTQKVITFLAAKGIDMTLIQSKVLLIILSLVAIFLSLKVVKFGLKATKWIIIALSIFLVISIGVSFI